MDTEKILEIFRFQAAHCEPYRRYIEYLGINPAEVFSVDRIPFFPIEFFKSEDVYCGVNEPQTVFTSSGTTGSVPSRHLVADLAVYENAFFAGFRKFYGDPAEYTIFALLPNYLERSGSSLVYMADRLMRVSGRGGFFLNNTDELLVQMRAANVRGEKILLLGVSFALWELAERERFDFHDIIVMETGGMKGRRREITRAELHGILCDSFGVGAIHSEYGMTELLSQGYSFGDGVFWPSDTLRIMVRDTYNPFRYVESGKVGGINVIDTANIYSCSFIETQDLGRVFADGSFTVEGRIDNSEIRGCNLMAE